MKGHKVYRLSIFEKKEKDGKEYPAVSSQNEYPFLLPAWRVDKIMKDSQPLLMKPARQEKIPVKPFTPKEA